MRRVIVAVPTYRRPARLAGLLPIILEQADALAHDSLDVALLVVDNDPEASARSVAEEARVSYVVEPARGLSAVRNRALDEAADADALVFIDDDELPAEGWLQELVGRWIDRGPAAVSGRVLSQFPEGFADRWILEGGFFTRVAFADGAAQHAAPTNNLLLDLGAVRRAQLRFDPAFGLSGGEDILLTKQLVRAGGVISSCPSALVYDPVDPARLTRRWVLARAYRVGISTVRTELAVAEGIGSRAFSRLRGVVGGLVRAGVGGVRWLSGTVVRSPRHSARGARGVARGGGMIVGAFGGDYDEYARRG